MNNDLDAYVLKYIYVLLENYSGDHLLRFITLAPDRLRLHKFRIGGILEQDTDGNTLLYAVLNSGDLSKEETVAYITSCWHKYLRESILAYLGK